MSGKFFLDTNIFLYSFDKTAPDKAHIADELIRRAEQTGTGVISFRLTLTLEFEARISSRSSPPLKAGGIEGL